MERVTLLTVLGSTGSIGVNTLNVVRQWPERFGIHALVAGRNVELRNFGVLEVQVRKARIGRNPNKPEAEVVIPQRAVVKFKSGKILKQQLKKIDLAKI